MSGPGSAEAIRFALRVLASGRFTSLDEIAQIVTDVGLGPAAEPPYPGSVAVMAATLRRIYEGRCSIPEVCELAAHGLGETSEEIERALAADVRAFSKRVWAVPRTAPTVGGSAGGEERGRTMKSGAAAERFGVEVGLEDVLGLEVVVGENLRSLFGSELLRLVQLDGELAKLAAAARLRSVEYTRLREVDAAETKRGEGLEKERARIVDALHVRLQRRVIP